MCLSSMFSVFCLQPEYFDIIWALSILKNLLMLKMDGSGEIGEFDL